MASEKKEKIATGTLRNDGTIPADNGVTYEAKNVILDNPTGTNVTIYQRGSDTLGRIRNKRRGLYFFVLTVVGIALLILAVNFF